MVAERLHMSLTDVEAMSPRQVYGWLEWFTAAKAPALAAGPDDDAIDMRTLSQAELRSMFHR